jgi:hypothetical protein
MRMKIFLTSKIKDMKQKNGPWSSNYMTSGGGRGTALRCFLARAGSSFDEERGTGNDLSRSSVADDSRNDGFRVRAGDLGGSNGGA